MCSHSARPKSDCSSFFFTMWSIVLSLGAVDGRLTVASLAVEHLIAPEGIDVTAPRFSWLIEPPCACALERRRRATF